MTTRPLFDTPPAPRPNAKRIKPPVIPVPARTPEVWTIQFTAAPDSDVPPVCRVRRLLKSAWRGYRLKARIVAQPTPAIAMGESTASQSSARTGGPES